MFLHQFLPELISWCYCSFYCCQELHGMQVPIQSQKRSVSFDQWYHLHPSRTVECSSPVSYQVQQHWRNLQMFLLQTFLPFQDKESSIVDNLHFRFDKKTVIMSFIACKWPFQFPSLSADIIFFMFINFINVSRYRTISDAATAVSANSLWSTCTPILPSRQIL